MNEQPSTGLRRWRTRLYLQIYLAFVVIILGLTAVAGLSLRIGAQQWGHVPKGVLAFAQDAAKQLPHDPQRLQHVLSDLGERYQLHLSIFDARGTLLASAGEPMPFTDPGEETATWFRRFGRSGVSLRLADGRIVAGAPMGSAGPHRFLVQGGFLLLLAGALAAGCYPLARRITRRLESLRRGVDAIGAGDLRARVPVQGSDEVAELAASFNQAAAHIEALVLQQKRMLASASHELRTPLTRLRVLVELLGDDAGAQHQRRLQEATRDIEELDELIGDILLAARLETATQPLPSEPVDLHELVASECARAEVRLEATASTPALVRGDGAALRRAVRNLLGNARRHGGGREVSVELRAQSDAWEIAVLDRGPGVPPSERERIFEPFYRPAGHREGKDGGVGLGLALVRQIAAQHGGEARYEPRDGGGSCFVLRLPTSST